MLRKKWKDRMKKKRFKGDSLWPKLDQETGSQSKGLRQTKNPSQQVIGWTHSQEAGLCLGRWSSRRYDTCLWDPGGDTSVTSSASAVNENECLNSRCSVSCYLECASGSRNLLDTGKKACMVCFQGTEPKR